MDRAFNPIWILLMNIKSHLVYGHRKIHRIDRADEEKSGGRTVMEMAESRLSVLDRMKMPVTRQMKKSV